MTTKPITTNNFPPAHQFFLGSSMEDNFNNNNNNNNKFNWRTRSNANSEQQFTIEEILSLMQHIGVEVKANNYSSQLANNIFILCQQLKNSGQHLEQIHKNELNKVFVALRQAGCRDNGQLGTPCRLKIMEIVELRAMAWRPNLAHTQYYLNRHEQQTESINLTNNNNNNNNNNIDDLGKIPQLFSTTEIPQQQQQQPNLYNNKATKFAANLIPQLKQPPMSIPPMSIQFTIPPPTTHNLFKSSDFSAQTSSSVPSVPPPRPPQMPSTPGCFFIPVTGGWPNNLMHNITQNSLIMQTSMPPPIPNELDWNTRQQMAAYLRGVVMGKPSSLLDTTNILENPHGTMALNSLMNAVGINKNINMKSFKSQPFKEEITIRNCDSGKIMGVRGRRVALVEEISKTIISFQKVETKSKDRVLTITGNTIPAIQYAKRLIEETIRRNVSPTRCNENPEEEEEEVDDDEKEEEEKNEISIETGKDGTLKLCCADPQILQAAQQALSEYLNKAHRTSSHHRLSAEERELRKERRKSMPLQSSLKKVNEIDNFVTNSATLPNTPIQETKKSFTGSTPNLLINSEIKMEKNNNLKNTTISYSRDEILALKEKTQQQNNTNKLNDNFSTKFIEIVQNLVPEILRKDE